MALDVYVMPIWRFKVGDFTSPIEAATGMRPKIVTPGGIVERPAPAGAIARWRARRQVKAIRKSVEAANRIQVRWTDEGGVAYCQQSRGFEPLRAFAKWLDCRNRFPHFGPAPDGNYYKHPAFLAQVDDLSCPHLVEHSCYSGYFLPCEFERLVKVEPFLIYGHWPSAHSVGSSPRLLRELERVQEELQVTVRLPVPTGRSADRGEDGISATARGRTIELPTRASDHFLGLVGGRDPA